MTISERDWNNYVQRLSQLDRRAGEAMGQYIKRYGTEDTEGLIVYANALVTKYGEGSAELAAQMYDEMAAAAKVSVPAAEPAEVASPAEVAKAVYKTLSSPPSMKGAVSRMVKQAGADTTLKNALRDGAEFAWVPSGDSCAFCITLASRGWQRASKKAIKGDHAEHIHAHCDCNYAIRFNSNTNVAGYDPEEYLRMYENAEGKTPEEKINAMRRAQRDANRDAANAQQRAAYRARRELKAEGAKKITLEGSTGAGKRDKMESAKLFPLNPVSGKPYSTHTVTIDDAQFGVKIGKHAKDYGLNPSDPSAREFLRSEIERIIANPDERCYGEWRGQEYPVVFHIKGEDVVIESKDGAFITILKGGVSNERVKNAREQTI